MNPIMLDFPDELTTERLLIRTPLPGDGAIVHEAIVESIESLRPWMRFVHPVPTIEDQEEYSRRARAQFILREDLLFNIFDKCTGMFLGSIGLHRIDWEARKFEMRYWIRKSASGYGFMTEAVNGLTEFAAKFLQANRIEIRCDTRNIASRKVAERCGYHLEAIFLKNFVDPDGQIRDHCIYAKVRLDDGTLGYPSSL
jgi:ribosomal-protein-serine acetyltransferase